MATTLTKYSKLLLSRIFWPLKPFLPLVQLIKVWHLVLILLAFNLIGVFGTGMASSTAASLARWPYSGYQHSQMALVYFQLGQEKLALQELNWAGRYRKTAEAKINQPALIKQEIADWEKILEDKKYSKEILMQLAFLNHLIYEDESAKNYWQQASYLDPTNEAIIELGKVISSAQ